MLKILLSLSLIFTSLPGMEYNVRINTPQWTSDELLHVAPLPHKKAETAPPEIKAKSALVVDLKSGKTLFEQNGYDTHPIASITKLMTAIIILEENSPEETVTVNKHATEVEGSKIWLVKEERVLVKDLIYGLLIQSGNDAAIALADHNAGSEEAFVRKMNSKAKLIGLENTHFINTTGLDEKNKNNISTAYELAILSKYALKKPLIKEAVAKSKLTIISLDNISHHLETTNKLLGNTPYIKGVKTGNTLSAGLCFIGLAANDAGNEVLTIVLDSEQRFEDTQKLVGWTYETYIW